jgi:carbon-monoxide dehydrogenase medium subunit
MRRHPLLDLGLASEIQRRSARIEQQPTTFASKPAHDRTPDHAVLAGDPNELVGQIEDHSSDFTPSRRRAVIAPSSQPIRNGTSLPDLLFVRVLLYDSRSFRRGPFRARAHRITQADTRRSMKPASFEYARPAHLEEACALLAAGDDARVIAGGQTLVPLMAMRLARPKQLIDIARIPELAFVRKDGDEVAIGATTRQCVLERDPVVGAAVPLLAKVMPFVGHAATRARGTVGGSLANADPAAEIALVAVTLAATLVYRQGTASTEIAAGGFFIGPMTTVLPAAGCLTAIRFPVWRDARIGVGFHEVSARRSDFAFASAAAQIALDESGICRRLALGIGAATACPLRLDAATAALVGMRATESTIREAVHAALADIEPLADLHASADYRRRAAAKLAVRAIADAYRDAEGTHAR